MKAVLLDKVTLGTDISFQEIEHLCDITYYDNTTPAELHERIEKAEIIITNKVVIDDEAMAAAKNLKLICVSATGYDHVDIPSAKKHGIVVCNVAGYSTESVAQRVLGYMLTFANSVLTVEKDMQDGLWQKSKSFVLLNRPLFELHGKTLGIVGYGKIGQRVASLARAFGMNILIAESIRTPGKAEGRTPLTDLLRRSDIVSLHVPLNADSRDLIARKELALMKPSAMLINAARGGVVNERDLYEALEAGEIAYAATDVLTQEPPTEGNILFRAKNMMITPHIAWASPEARTQLLAGITRNITLFQQGKGDSIDICKQ
ncbi:MAG: glycerate dehydrogenase [Bacteroidia bacterium]|nr:MAG: glycerate dehydrogenase [Bacteroidia bacterium]